jgi:predicted solute-binding protein
MRIGITPYLNARPLARGLAGQPGLELVFATPARLADLLRWKVLDAALVSSSEYFNGDYLIVPECAISSQGGGADALDEASRSTNLLLRLAMHWLRPGAAITYLMRPADSCRSLRDADACLMIGDAALSDCYEAGLRYDVAEIWYERMRLPVVFTLWLAHRDANPQLADVIRRAYRDGMARLDDVAAQAARELGWDEAFVHHYLTEVLDYRWTDLHAESLRQFGEALYQLDLVEHRHPLRFLNGEQPGDAASAASANQPSSHAT